ncbi:MAG: hypothetical protein HQL93_13060, partial [Magnetococcales bacterium]|nr:hypothetical protein [Magnetococcales bacterium]
PCVGQADSWNEPSLQKAPDGFSNLFLKITDLEDSHSLSFNNQAGRYTGIYNAKYQGALFNITGVGDWLSAVLVTNPVHLKYSNSLGLNYVRPFGEQGGNVQLGFSTLRYQLDPDEVGNQTLAYEGDSSTFSLRFERPFFVDKGDFWWGIGAEKKSSSAKTLFNEYFDASHRAGDTAVHGEDRLFVGEFSLRANAMDDLVSQYPAANSISMKVKHAFPGIFGSMTDDDIRRKLENLAKSTNQLNIDGPVGNVEGMEADFWKYYVSISRMQMLPQRLTASILLEGEYTPSGKIPKAYEFVGANNGAYGFKYTLSVGRSLYQDLVNLVVGYRGVNSYAHYWNESPGCGDATQVTGLYRCSTDSGFLNLAFKYGLFFSDIEYQSSIRSFEQNQEVVKFNIGTRW